MKSVKKCLCTMLFLAFLVPVFLTENVKADDSGNTIISVPITVQEEYGMANEFFQILNQNRRAVGLPEYKLDAGLMEMAMTRSAQMCIYFSHASMISKQSEHDALGDLQQGTPIQNAIGVIEDIADGTADARSTYKVWYDSLTHRPALISSDYNYCGIGVVTYHDNIKWCLIVSQSPCGNSIPGVSGRKTVTRNISAKIKYFARKSVAALDEWVNNPFRFSDIDGGYEGYLIERPGIFTFKNENPELFDVDSMGRITPKADGKGSLYVYYKDSVKVCTVSVFSYHDEPQTETSALKTENSNIQDSLKQTETSALKTENSNVPAPPKQTEPKPSVKPPKQTETVKQSETVKQTERPKQTDSPKKTEVSKQTEKPKQTETSKAIRKKFIVKTSNVVYSGKKLKPSLKVYVGKKKLSSKYYKVVKYQNNKNVGYGTVFIKGRGKYARYSGTAKFKILPGKVKLSGVSYSKGRMRVEWKRNSGVNGYQIVYGTKKSLKNAKSKKVGANTKSVRIKVPARKTYYVKIRSYKKVGKEVWYSGWSTVKKIRAK